MSLIVSAPKLYLDTHPEYMMADAECSILLYSEALTRSMMPERKLCAIRTLQEALLMPIRFIYAACLVASSALAIFIVPFTIASNRLALVGYHVVLLLLSPLHLTANILSIALRMASVAVGILLPCLAIRGLKLAEQLAWVKHRIHDAISQKLIATPHEIPVLFPLNPSNAIRYLDKELATKVYSLTNASVSSRETLKLKIAAAVEGLLKELLKESTLDVAKILGVVSPYCPTEHPASYDEATNSALQNICANRDVKQDDLKKVDLFKLLNHLQAVHSQIKALIQGKAYEFRKPSGVYTEIVKAVERLPIVSVQKIVAHLNVAFAKNECYEGFGETPLTYHRSNVVITLSSESSFIF